MIESHDNPYRAVAGETDTEAVWPRIIICLVCAAVLVVSLLYVAGGIAWAELLSKSNMDPEETAAFRRRLLNGNIKGTATAIAAAVGLIVAFPWNCLRRLSLFSSNKRSK